MKSPTKTRARTLFYWRNHRRGLWGTYFPTFWKYGSRNSYKFAYK